VKISLITPTYNSAATIARTIESVLLQGYADLEYIIIDGTSSDNTREIVAFYQNKLNIKFISEPDDGLYDAMNKGIKLATGEIIGILNSDDFFSDNNVLNSVAAIFKDNKTAAVYGDIKYFSTDPNKTTRYWRAGDYQESKLANGWVIPHPALFLRCSVYEQVGLFKIDFKIAADYEFILRLLKKHKINVKYLPQVLVSMYDGGVSGRNLEQRKKGWAELKKAWTVNGWATPKLFILRRLLFKFSQYISK